jgi:hypothetical protein
LRATSVKDILLPGAVGKVLEVFAKGGYWGRFAVVIGDCSATAGNNKLIPGWPINLLVGYAIHEWHILVRNTLKYPYIREWHAQFVNLIYSWVGQNKYLQRR